MSRPTCCLPHSLLIAGLLLAWLASWERADRAWSAEPDSPAAPPAAPPEVASTGGARYVNAQIGIEVQGPAGWDLSAKSTPRLEWLPLAEFKDPQTNAHMAVTVRRRDAATLDDLLAVVRKEWSAMDAVELLSLRKVDGEAGRRPGFVTADGTLTPPPTPARATGPVPPLHVNATYVLAPSGEIRLFTTVLRSQWPRVRPLLDGVRAGLKVAAGAEREGGGGSGTYRNDRDGCQCRVPEGFGVVETRYPNQVVGFEGVAQDAPRLGIYRIPYSEASEEDAKRLVAYYVEDQGGEAEWDAATLLGKEAALVTARVDQDGVPMLVLLLSVKRGDDELWRLKASGPTARESDLRRAWKVLRESFRWIARE